ncbi:hypothetical protein WR25_10424 isoform D [Diploscapter pachys]|uniref:SET domain-containing protein n=1 Tax=Diploscapter pachys TaxID=2018661 RepID=A0A2A2JLR8_9BILA|nr:hypothetical protein WR25_10424 isoform A [Diploscapter pachys]PAV62636.1 hypothetical protein WR25_10424 isoform B [Diploscapter pachys]PAV62637.1 hypothetical protein WR25_10424 isoform C [Diploscapter pachys]PAV62638.1 hypothetical protein WR25_10424 isoform D [Diploscapter pachys]
MVLEAVPCVFRSNQEGNETCFGYLIRSSDETASTSSSGPRTTPVSMPAVVSTSPSSSNSNPGPNSSSSNPTATSRSITPSSASTAPLLMQGFHPNGTPIVVNPVNGEHPPKILVPANIQVRLQSTTSGPSISSDSSTSASSSWPLPPNTKIIPITSGGSSFIPPNVHNTMSSPCPSQPRSISVCSASPLTDTSPMSPNLIAYPYSSSAHHSQIPCNSRGVRPQPTAASGPAQGNGNNTDSSTTPDSGIQSVPTSPPDSQQLSPPTMEPCDSVCEVDTYDRVDYDDMPRLFPADQEDEEDTTPSSSSLPPALREDGLSHGSECETTPAPTISITRAMDSDEIVDKLIELAPDKISLIANLIKKKTTQQRKRKSNSNLTNTSTEAPVLEPVTKRKRRESAVKIELKSEPQVIEPTPELVKSEKKRGRKKKQSEQTLDNILSMPKLDRPEDEVPTEAEDVDPEYDIKTYRKAMNRMLQDMLIKNVERITSDIGELHICRDRHDKKLQKDKIKMWNIDWIQVKLRSKKREEQRKKLLTLEAEKDKEKSKRIARVVDAGQKLTGKLTPITLKLKKTPENEAEIKRRKTSPITSRKRGLSESRLRSEATSSCEKKPPETRDGEVQTSFSDGRIPHWEAPLLRCGCSRGACTSDAECINRALCVQCSSSCDAPLCANKKFWKRDATKYLIASGPKTKRVLRTRQARRAGEFLCEFAGEVISYDEAVKRVSDYSSDPQTPSRILCLSSRLFIDATIRSNIGRYVRHSCRPNSRIEVWTVGGRLRAGIFSLFEIASGAEITIDMDRLLPAERECHCDASNCKKTLRAARNAVLANSSELSLSEEKSIKDGRVFLLRNRRKTTERAMKHGIPQEFIDNFGAKSCSPAALRQIVIGLLYRMRRIDGSLPYVTLRGYTRVESILKEVERRKSLEGNFDIIESFKTHIQKWLDEVDDDDLDRVYTALRQRYLDDKFDDKKSVHQNSARKRENSKKVRPETDLSYLLTNDLVGSYNPDADACANSRGMKRTTDEDAVRIILDDF